MTLRARILLSVAVVAATLVPLAGPARAAGGPPVVWRRELPGGAIRESSPVLVDLDESGTLDVVVGAHDNRVHALRGGDGVPVAGWPQPVSDPVNSSAAVADVTGDGRPEVFVGAGAIGGRSGALYSFEGDGVQRFRRALPDPDFPAGAPVHASPAVGDIDGDGAPDVSVGTLGVRSLWSVRGHDGAPIGGRELFYWDDTIFSSPALADVNGDGRLDVIVGGDSSPGAPVDWQGGMVRAVSGTGASLWEFRTNDIVRSSPAVGDIDGDGRLEVVVGVGDYWHGGDATAVFALDAATGALKWRRHTDGVTNAAPALADVDGDGKLDVAIGTFNGPAQGTQGGSVYVLRGSDGGDVAGFPTPSGGGVVLGGIVTADVNGDGGQDLFVPTGAYIAVFSGKGGARLFNLAEGDGVSFLSSPAVADVDGDGTLDVVAAGTHSGGSGMVYRWALAGARVGVRGWPQFHKDTRRTGSWTSTVPDATTLPFDRQAGADRFATAVALSAGAPSGGLVYVATGMAFADALAGGPAASVDDAPVLLVTSDQLPSSTRQRLVELRPRQILVLGGPSAVSDAVVAQLSGLATAGAMRVAGSDRYGTAAAVSAQAFNPLVDVAYIATGAGFADALSGSAAAGREGGPVLLVERDRIPSATSTELRRLLPKSIVILGGTGVVSDAVEAELRSYSVSVSRLAGGDRYASAVATSKATYGGGAPVAFIATGGSFPDALAGGPVAAARGGPLLLVPGRCVLPVVRAELERLGVQRIVLLGGQQAVAASIAALTPC